MLQKELESYFITKHCCHGDVLLQAKHAVENNLTWGIDGDTGKIVDMNEYGVWEAFSVKAQTYKTSIEVSGNYVLAHVYTCTISAKFKNTKYCFDTVFTSQETAVSVFMCFYTDPFKFPSAN